MSLHEIEPATTAPATTAPMPVLSLDAADVDSATAVLVPCCASRRWVAELVGTRPHRTLTALTAASEAVLGRLDWPDVVQALDAHPRIGDRIKAGPDRESVWSRQEQSGTATAETAVVSELAAGNALYESQFGHVFLICATGLSAAEMLANLRHRLGNEPDAEHRTVRVELAKIVRLRLAKAFC